MNIGFDAKRAFHNHTGLGHYSRTLIRSLSEVYPGHQYFLFNPKPSTQFSFQSENLHEVLPTGFPGKWFPSLWRSQLVKKDLQKLKIDLYHGLSHEIPMGLPRTGIRSVVTIHDLIHERHPEQYNPVDVRIYRKKFRYACANADRIIAISEQTRKDIIDFYQTDPAKIRVCYQSCNPAFGVQIGDEEKKAIRELYQLPLQFFLYVGSVIERKNLLNICKAINLLRNELNIPLVIIGEGGGYKQKVKDYIRQNGLESLCIFLSEKESARQSKGFRTATDFPAIYQSAIALIYPSFFEGFGIPVLEALWSHTPVITSTLSCLPEAGGKGAYYVNPAIPEEIATGMKKLYQEPELARQLTSLGWEHAQHFSVKNCAEAVMNVYQELF